MYYGTVGSINNNRKQCINESENENETVCFGCQYTNLYSHLIIMFIRIILEIRCNLIEKLLLLLTCSNRNSIHFPHALSNTTGVKIYYTIFI